MITMLNQTSQQPLSAAAPPASYGCTESLRATGGCTLEIHRQVLKGRLRGQRADASTGHAEAFAADSCSDLLVFLLDMNNAPFVIDSVFISLSLIKGAYQSETGVIL